MNFLLFVLLFVFDVVQADFCMLGEPHPDCDGYCYTSIKPFLSYIPFMQKRLEACETINPSYGHDILKKFNSQLTQQLELTKSMQTSDQLYEDLYKCQSKLNDMKEHLKNEEGKCQGQKKFKRVGNKYYYFPQERVDWFSALQLCSKWGGHLVSLESAEELNNIKPEMCADEHIWVNINDLNKEGTFVSATTGMFPVFQNWQSGKPNGGKRENCVRISPQESYEMNDASCNNRLCFVCESHSGN